MSPLNRLALAPGFNPQSLPDVAPPVPESRPWRWLAERAADSAEHEAYRAAYRANSRDGRAAPEPTELQAYLARFVAGFGTVDPTDRMVVLQPRPAERVIASHLAQDVVFDFDGAPLVTVRLSAASPDESEGSFPFAGPVAIVGTIPPSRCAVQALGRNLRRELQSHLDGCGIRHLRAVAVDSGRRWLEDALIVDYADGEQVRFAARLFLQPYLTVWRWQDGRSILEVVDLAEWPAERVVASGHASLGRLGHRPCPLIPGSSSADLCQMHGGPWVSRSIRAASRWEDKRSRMLAAVGCDTCGDGAVKVGGGRPLRVVQGGRNTHRVRLDEGVQSRHDELVGADDEAAGSRTAG